VNVCIYMLIKKHLVLG